MKDLTVYFSPKDDALRFFSRWDVILMLFIFSIFFFISLGASQMSAPYHLGAPLPITLALRALPGYALRTVLRLFIALFFSLLVTFVIGTLAAKNKRAEKILIPTIDILQSVPVLSFLSITVTLFIRLFPNSLLGPECAAIFVIFTAQVWNMIFGFYQSLKMVPNDLKEAAIMFQLSPWQRFWKVEVPFSMPSLIWNMMVSMSASWFFVVLSEAILVAHQEIRLPGIGSYIALAIEKKNLMAVFYAIFVMIFVIFLYDQILFRPLVAWSDKFNAQDTPSEVIYQSWLIDFGRKSYVIHQLLKAVGIIKEWFINCRWFSKKNRLSYKISHFPNQLTQPLSSLFAISIGFYLFYTLYQAIFQTLTFHDVITTIFLGSITALRVIILILLSSLIWVPIGVYIGQKPRLAQRIQPIIQFVAAFPANLFYPIFVITIVHFHINVEIGLTPLMILGTQWYILFNVIAGTLTIPRELYLAANNYGVKGWLWWRRLALPGIFPYYVTGAISAAGGAWNASIVAEWANWGDITLKATGLGAYIQAATIEGNFAKLTLGTVIMCTYVIIFNHILWRPLYRFAEERCRLT